MKYGTENHPRLNILQEIKKIRRKAEKLATLYEKAEGKPLLKRRIIKKAEAMAQRLGFLMAKMTASVRS